jgi:hypothetical protein
VAVARLALAPEFSDKLSTLDKFPIIFDKANDNIASRKLPAALCIANLVGRCRLTLSNPC